MFRSPGPVAFDIGPVEIRWYGLIIALAFLTGLFVTARIAKKENINLEHILDLSSYLLIGAILGARLYFVLFNWPYYSQNPDEILKIWQGGLSIHGGIIGGLLVGTVYTVTHKLPTLKYADLFSYGLIIGQTIGRWGNFFNSEAFGSPTGLPWKLYIPPNKRPEEFIEYQYFHPTFLYESLWNIMVFCILYFVLRKRFKDYNGAIFFSYLILYSLGRFIIEGIRVDSIYSILGMPLAQFVSLMTIIIGLIGLYFVTVYPKRARQ